MRRKQPPVLTALRAQVNKALYAVPAKRKPALRRCDAADALFATDLPLIALPEDITAFCQEMEKSGWRCDVRSGWLTLDAPIPVPDVCIPANRAGECGCCITLLERHPGTAPAEAFIRAVVKAEEAGLQPFERLCTQLHGELAARLRLHRELPGALLPYLCHADQHFYK